MAALVCSLVAALAFALLGDARGHLGPALSLLLAWGAAAALLRPPEGGAARVLAAALLVRAMLVAAPASLSDDLFRYLWEGRAVGLGGNPYLHAPAWEGWPEDPIRAAVNHPEVSTIYPPLAMALFTALAGLCYDPMVVKIAFGLADAGVAWGIARVLEGRGRRIHGAWVYALHPLGAVESAGSGHLDSLALLGLVLAIRGWDLLLRRNKGDAGVLAAVLGAGVKLFPALILPALLRAPGPRRSRWIALLLGAGLMLALSAPFWEAGPALVAGLSTYARHWSFNGSLYPLLEAATRWLGGEAVVARRIATGLGALVVAVALVRRRDPAEVALWAGGAFVLLSPTVHPWYVGWAWVPALICGVRAWTVLATLVPLAYAVLATLDPVTGAWREPTWTRLAIYGPFFVVLGLEWAGRAVLPGPWSPRARGG